MSNLPGAINTGVLPTHIPDSTLAQHAEQLKGHDASLSSNLLLQGAPLGTYGNMGSSVGTSSVMGTETRHTPIIQGAETITGSRMVTEQPLTGIPVGTTGFNQAPMGTTGFNQAPIGTTGFNQATVGPTGAAGVSQATGTHIYQGSNVKGPLVNPQGLIQSNVLPGHTVPGNTTAQGQFTFRPLEGRFTKDKDLIGKMDPYVKIKIGWHTAKSSVAQGQGMYPTWGDAITLPRKHNETFAKLKVKDRDRLTKDDRLGSVKINLDEIVQKGRVQQWYPITTLTGQPRGEILMDIEYAPLFIK